ncbi:phosphoribosylaminoimidazole carboxylase [Pseudomassariella vexata]|uniref:Phosphoribosylaminoimidazole carboxylase n=1 Tax=Pseudomassariella vexata TaxID=1141098 RepID=A0A1Y2DE94_9PEZI|nr:phosphoribosylaminoimidazole carboxylase [Pseudomassariella vexata]ORY57527.1 phosphoribosylaminoimidazole carboxylase [Pseudomassariella vexata]
MAQKPVIGLLGGGQLGLMLCEAAGPLGTVEIAVLDAEDCPAKHAARKNGLHVTGSFKDPAKIKELAARCDVLTVEIEHVDTEILEEIATKGVEVDGKMKKVPVHPSWKTIRLIQDKYQQKEYFGQKGIPIAEQMAIKSGSERKASLHEVGQKFGFPFMLKGSKGSYDGRGNFKIRTAQDFDSVAEQMGDQPLYAEKWVTFDMELAVMVVRVEDDDGKLNRVLPYPVVETVHEDSICTKVFFPPRNTAVTEEIKIQAQKVACDVVASLWGRGVFAVEMFLKDGQILVNEVAPRPHNSGHYTIEAVHQMSQYKAQLVSILNKVPKNLDLSPTVSSAIMLNILGGAEPTSHDRLANLAEELTSKYMHVFLHQYGKESKPGRKIGHITATGSSSIGQLEERARPLITCVDEIRAERVGGSPPAGTSSQGSKPDPLVAVTMGSDSDLNVMIKATDILEEFGVPYTWNVTSAHRTPEYMEQKAAEWSQGSVKVIIAGAGGAAHLPGMLASITHLPCIGVPVKGSTCDGMDSLLSIVQMPRGIPVATMGINNATNAALEAVRILGNTYPEYVDKMRAYQKRIKVEVLAKDRKAQVTSPRDYLKGM